MDSLNTSDFKHEKYSISFVRGGDCRRLCDVEKSTAIPIIDTHIHLYDTTRPEGVPWPPETDKVLYKPILTEHFDKVTDENGVNATVIVEASKWIPDNQWVLDLVKHDPNRYIGLVGSLEIGTPISKSTFFNSRRTSAMWESVCANA